MIVNAVKKQGISRHGAKMISAMASCTTPRICVVVRKAYGAGLYAMSGPGFDLATADDGGPALKLHKAYPADLWIFDLMLPEVDGFKVLSPPCASLGTPFIAGVLQDLADVDTARTLSESLARLRERRPDLVILDLMMPDGHGFELLPLLGGNGTPAIPVILFSALEVPNDVLSRVAGAFVKSKTTPEDLIRAIRGLI